MPKKRKSPSRPARSAPKRLLDSVGGFLAGAATKASGFFGSLDTGGKKGTRVFVYGGHGAILDQSQRVGEAELPGYSRVRHQGKVAIVRSSGTVHGQVYEVDHTTMLLLNQQYGSGFRRQQVRVNDGSLAWTYVYVGQGQGR